MEASDILRILSVSDIRDIRWIFNKIPLVYQFGKNNPEVLVLLSCAPRPGHGKGYNIFAGQDASRAFVSGEFDRTKGTVHRS